MHRVSRQLRRAAGWLLLAALMAGCPKRGPRPENPGAPSDSGPESAFRRPGKKVLSGAPATAELAAQIKTVQPALKFVVIDFGARLIPVAGARREVYRAGKRVGTVQITGPIRGRFTAADVVEGELEAGDEVR
jgi:hypothetical protein